LRVRQDGDNVLTKSVQVGNVATEPLPGDEVKLPDPVAIQEARTAADGEIVTLEGIVTSETGSFGGKGFYMQDDTAGIYVFQDSGSFQPGDRIQITGVKTTYNDEVELTDVIQSEVIGQADIPAPKVVSAVDETNQGQLVKLTEVTVTNVEEVNTYGTFEFDAKEADGHVTRVRVDNRIGLDYSTFVSQFQEGDIVNITGVSSIFNGIYQLKPVAPDNITDFVQTEEPVEEKPLPAPCKTDNGKHKGADKGKGKGKGHDKSWKCAA
jgi:DNA/RNA endonuclease YhcR with UshA esterase domain